MSLCIICDLIALILAICSLIFSSTSANWSYKGWTTSSVIRCCSSSLEMQDCDSRRQYSYSLLIESISSVTKSIDFPRGFVDWHKIWIAFFINSMSFSVNPPEPAPAAADEDLGRSTPPTFFANCSWPLAAAPVATFFYGPSLRTIFTPPPAAGASWFGLSPSSSSYCISFLASSTNAPCLPSAPASYC